VVELIFSLFPTPVVNHSTTLDIRGGNSQDDINSFFLLVLKQRQYFRLYSGDCSVTSKR
jgi:hypothetical protein